VTAVHPLGSARGIPASLTWPSGTERSRCPGYPDQTLFVYTASAGTASGQALDLLASWTAAPGPGDRHAGVVQRHRAV